MGPTNEALVRLFGADQKYRQAQARHDAASRDVRIQQGRVNDLESKLSAASTQLKDFQTKAGTTELDIKAREQKIERFREQQQTAKNNKEYQTFLVQINTEKVDKNKVEDELLKLMEQIEKSQVEVKQLTGMLETEKQKLQTIREQITGRLETLKQEIEQCKPARDEAAAAVNPSLLVVFDRLADRFDGEAMAPISRPDKRVEEYVCGACNMSMAVDMYNRLHSRDEAIFCPSCRRFLYIPEDMTPEAAIKQKKKPKKEKEEAPAEAAAQDPQQPTPPATPEAQA
jgi:predicted  nucleic acid-binding Zn-ribbon protein